MGLYNPIVREHAAALPGMRNRVDGLDLLRAAAIALVVIDHGALFFYLCYGWPILWARLGVIGVTLFFALSGYLIGGLLLDLGPAMRSPLEAGTFWVRRALRTLPNYYLFIALNIGFWGMFQQARDSTSPLPLLPQYAFFLQNFGSAPSWFFPESWSLAVEEWFYLVFPLLLLLSLRITRQPFRHVYWATTLVVLLVPPLLRAFCLTPEDWSHGVTKVVIYRPDSIALGLAAVAWSREHPLAWARARHQAAFLGLALLLWLWLYLGYGNPDHSAVARVLLYPGISLGCAMLLPWASQCREFRSPWVAVPVRRLARWSYSMYLVNLMMSTTLLSHVQVAYGTAAGIAAYLVGCVVASAAIYRWFESPIMRWRDRVLHRPPHSEEREHPSSAAAGFAGPAPR